MNATSSPSDSAVAAVGVGAVDRDAERGRLLADTEARPDVAGGGSLRQFDLDGRAPGALPQHREQPDADADHVAGTDGRFIDRQSTRVHYAALVPSDRRTDSGIAVPVVATDSGPHDLGLPGRVPVHARRPRRRLPRRGRGRCASTRASRRPRRRTRASGCCSSAGRPACRWRSTCRPSSGSTRTTRAPPARSGAPGVAHRLGRRHAAAVRRHPARRGLDVDDDQRARARAAAALRAGRRRAGRRVRASCAGRCRTTSSRSTPRAATTSSRRGPRCA